MFLHKCCRKSLFMVTQTNSMHVKFEDLTNSRGKLVEVTMKLSLRNSLSATSQHLPTNMLHTHQSSSMESTGHRRFASISFLFKGTIRQFRHLACSTSQMQRLWFPHPTHPGSPHRQDHQIFQVAWLPSVIYLQILVAQSSSWMSAHQLMNHSVCRSELCIQYFLINVCSVMMLSKIRIRKA